MSKQEQKLINFQFDTSYKSDDFFVSKSNFFAFSLLDSWPKWEKNILNIHGEKYCGKSHLSEIFIKKNKGIILKPRELQPNFEKNLRYYENIIVDNLDEGIDEKIIFSLINFVDQNLKYLIINSLTPFNKMKFKLNDLLSRAKNCLDAKIEKPDDELIKVLIYKYLSDKQIKINNKLVEFAAKRITRSYGKIFEFIYKIDEISLKKKKSIDQKTIKEALEI
tara:strand:+ start:2575 stop:3237 length:663 start_codon:yes stop_codon:yes gene_type:complete